MFLANYSVSLVGLLTVAILAASQASSIMANPSCSKPLIIGKDPKKSVCVISEVESDKLEVIWPTKSGASTLIESSERGARFLQRQVPDLDWGQFKLLGCNKIKVNLDQEHQAILGWGGSFTDAAGVNLKSLSTPVADKLLEAYYGSDGLQYNFGRVPIAGTDFSVRNYTYDDVDHPDLELINWSLTDEDTNYKIPYIKQAKQLVEKTGAHLKLIASPWSAPAWMKTNNKLIRGRLIPTDQMYSTYTKYLMRFYQAYRKQGLDFWGATVQNEPFAANLPIYFFNSMQFNAKQMARLIRDYLGPALEAHDMGRDKFKLIIGDDSLGFINNFVPQLLEDNSVSRYVSGLGFHWYTSGSIYSYDKLLDIYAPFKNKLEFMLMTEACTGSSPLSRGPRLGMWKRAEQYAQDIIQDLNRFTNGWIDWNLALDLSGGPNWSGNFVDAAIIVDSAKNQFYKQPMYYALAHFSKLFRPGAIRVDTNTCSSLKDALVSSVAVVDHDTGHLIVNVLNRGKKSQVVDIEIKGSNELPASHTQKLRVKGHSLISYILKF